MKIKGLTEDERKEATSVHRSEPKFFENRNTKSVEKRSELSPNKIDKPDVTNQVEYENNLKANEDPNKLVLSKTRWKWKVEMS